MPTIVQRYKDQRSRGSQGFGFFVPSKNRLTHNTEENRILSLLKREADESEILFHHRYPTSTANVRQGCHPYSTKDHFDTNFVAVHNGVLRNQAELRIAHEKLGIKYVSVQENQRFNDSEALAYDLALYLDGQQDALQAKGSIAFIVIKRDTAGKPVTLFFGRNSGNPLKMKKTKYSLTLSSEGEGEMIETNVLYSMSYDTLEITKRPCIIQTGYVSTYNSGFKPIPRQSDYTTPVYSTRHDRALDYEDDDFLESTKRSWDTQDENALDAQLAHTSEVNDLKQSFLYETQYDTFLAIGYGKALVSDLETKQLRLDLMSQDEEQLEKITDDEINEYVGLDDKIDLYNEAIDSLKRDHAKAVVRGESRQQSIGFHTPATPHRTGVTHPVPTRQTNTKNGQGCYPFSD